MITILNISINNKYKDKYKDIYNQERELRNKTLPRLVNNSSIEREKFDFKSHHFVAVKNKKVIGCVLLLPIEGTNKCKLLQMAVSEVQQGQGIGKELIFSLLKFAKENNFKEIFCHSRESAVNFYQKFGFCAQGEYFQEVGFKHIQMQKILFS